MLGLYESEALLAYRMSELARELEHSRLVAEALGARKTHGEGDAWGRLLIWLGGTLMATGRYLQLRGGLPLVPATPSAIAMHTLLITCLPDPRILPGTNSTALHLNAPAGRAEGERPGV
jgi:hypothetical protein